MNESNNKMGQGEADRSDQEREQQPAGLKEGAWTAQEDEILREHVKRHRTENWNSVSRLSGLARSGKSCRLRWTNHLRPDLKKVEMSPEEEEKIILLHSQMGNKWAKIPTQLEGRTENEIKRFWYTWMKRCQRLKKPIHSPHIRPQAIAVVPNEDHDGGIRPHPNEQTKKEGPSMNVGGISPIFPPFSDLLGAGFWFPLAPVQPPFGGTMGIGGFSNGDNVLSGQPPENRGPETMELPSIQYGGGNFLAWSAGPPEVSAESIELPLEAMGNVTAPPRRELAEMIQELQPRSMSNQVVLAGNLIGNVTAPPPPVSPEMVQELPAGAMGNEVVPVGNFNGKAPLHR